MERIFNRKFAFICSNKMFVRKQEFFTKHLQFFLGAELYVEDICQSLVMFTEFYITFTPNVLQRLLLNL